MGLSRGAREERGTGAATAILAAGGMYFSKRDQRVWVPKSVPALGWTLNLGTRAGASWMIALMVGLPVLMIALMGLAIRR